MNAEASILDAMKWALGLGIVGFIGWLIHEIRDVRNYASSRFHELNNKMMRFQDHEEAQEQFDAMRGRLDQLRDMINGRH